MPLSDHEQRILDEIERRLAEDDPKLVEQVGRTDLYTHLTRRIRLAGARLRRSGALLLLLFVVSLWIAVVGFVVMVVSALLISATSASSGATRSARCRPRAALDHGHHRPDRRATAAAGAALEPD